MKKLILILAILFSTIVNSYAVTREYPYQIEGQSNFEKVGVSGNLQPGNPGYLTLVTADTAGATITYYLWVGNDGKLKIASYPTISAYASFPNGNWTTPAFNAGTVVGSQS